MQDLNLIQVLWVENDPVVIESYPLKAEQFGLQLEPYSCWDDAKVALERDFNRWSAIILDAKCKYHRDDNDNTIVFLREALKGIAVICEKEGRIIPWYVLTGGDDKTDVSDSINDDRMKWDADWTKMSNKKYYSKNLDNEILYERIKIHAQKSPRIQLQEIYSDLYKQLSRLNKEVCEDIFTILETMHYPKSHPNFCPRLFYNPMRKALEYVYRTARNVDIIPEDFFAGGIVNLNQCFMFLIGRDAEKIGFRYGSTGEKIVPRHIHDMMSLIINLGNSNSHSTESSHSTELSEEEIHNYDNHIKSIGGNSNLLIFSIALQFCEIVKWFNQYIAKHSDKEKNKKKQIRLNDLIGVIEQNNGLYHIGSNFSVLIKQKEWIGKKVQIIKFCPNTSLKTKDIFPYFVHYNDIRFIEEQENGSK